MPKRSADVETMAHELMGHFDELVREFLINEEGGNYSANEKSLLRFLRDHGPAVMSDLSAHLRLALSSTTGVVDRLVERKVVKRVRPEEDRRTVRVMLTNRGGRALEGLAADRVRLGRAMLDRLEPHRRKTLLALFRQMAGGAK
jgi:DNA-binding MarR family transcriptional regulator